MSKSEQDILKSNVEVQSSTGDEVFAQLSPSAEVESLSLQIAVLGG